MVVQAIFTRYDLITVPRILSYRAVHTHLHRRVSSCSASLRVATRPSRSRTAGDFAVIAVCAPVVRRQRLRLRLIHLVQRSCLLPVLCCVNVNRRARRDGDQQSRGGFVLYAKRSPLSPPSRRMWCDAVLGAEWEDVGWSFNITLGVDPKPKRVPASVALVRRL